MHDNDISNVLHRGFAKLQAPYHGYQTRKRLQEVESEFFEVVREIEGDTCCQHYRWPSDTHLLLRRPTYVHQSLSSTQTTAESGNSPCLTESSLNSSSATEQGDCPLMFLVMVLIRHTHVHRNFLQNLNVT